MHMDFTWLYRWHPYLSHTHALSLSLFLLLSLCLSPSLPRGLKLFPRADCITSTFTYSIASINLGGWMEEHYRS